MRKTLSALARFAVAALIVIAIALVFNRLVHTNSATVGFTFLLGVLMISALWGLRYAIFVALSSALAFNYFFLPPVGTFSIADPQNWVALVAFLITAVIGSELSEKARREAKQSQDRRCELEQLYVLSQQLLSCNSVESLANAVPAQIAATFEALGAALYVAVPPEEVYYSDAAIQRLVASVELERMARKAQNTINVERAITFLPLRLGERSLGALAIVGTNLSRESMEAIASLLAIAIDRAGAVEKLARAEADRESERLRSVLLDSVTHDFRTPLTAIKASAQSLQGAAELDDSARQELLTVITEESDRLDRLVGEAAEMAQLDAKGATLVLAPHDISEAIDLALESGKNVLARHRVRVEVADQLPLVNIDLRRIQEVVSQFLDNAAKYSPAGSVITITSEVQDKMLVTKVTDEGPGIAPADQQFVFEKFFRGRRGGGPSVQGTGMGLAIAKAIVEAHGGSIGFVSKPGQGTTFHFELPSE